MSKEFNNSILCAAIGIFAIFMAPFMAVGHLWAITLDQMQVLYDGGGYRVYGWALNYYGGWPKYDGVEQGFAMIKVVGAVVLFTPVVYAFGVITVYAGAGFYLFLRPLALTPWPAVDHYLIPAILGLLQLVMVMRLFRNKVKAPLAIAAIPALAVPFMMLGLPLLLMILTGVHTVLR